MNDHDPLPLLRQLAARDGDRLEVSDVTREPGPIASDFEKR